MTNALGIAVMESLPPFNVLSMLGVDHLYLRQKKLFMYKLSLLLGTIVLLLLFHKKDGNETLMLPTFLASLFGLWCVVVYLLVFFGTVFETDKVLFADATNWIMRSEAKYFFLGLLVLKVLMYCAYMKYKKPKK